MDCKLERIVHDVKGESMEIKSKFNLNQGVWSIDQERSREWQRCAACDGSGKVTLKDGNPRYCPECYDNKGRFIYKELAWQVGTMLTIGQIRVEITNAVKDEDQMFDNICHYEPGKSKQKEQYMMYQTGINCGTLWNTENLFPSYIEAEEECDRRNASERTDKV